MHFLEMLVFYYSIIGWTKEYLWLQFWLLLNVSSVIIKLWLCYNGALLDEYIYIGVMSPNIWWLRFQKINLLEES